MARKTPTSAFGVKLRELREGLGLDQQSLAVKLGLSEPTIRRIEIGWTMPSWQTVQKIAAAFGVSTEVFVDPEIAASTPRLDHAKQPGDAELVIEAILDPSIKVPERLQAQLDAIKKRVLEEGKSHE